MQIFFGHTLPVTCGMFTLDGKRIATGSEDGTIKIWSPKSASCASSFSLHFDQNSETNGVTFISCHPSDANLICSAGSDGTAKISNLTSGKVLHTFRHKESVESCIVFKNTQVHLIATAGLDTFVKIWEFSNENLRSTIPHKVSNRFSKNQISKQLFFFFRMV